MNVYYLTRWKDITEWCEDDGMVVIAANEKEAEELARNNSDDFSKSRNIKVEQVNLDKAQVVLISNTGA